MPRLIGVSAVLGFFSIIQSFGLLLIGLEVLSDRRDWAWLGLSDRAHLQTLMFLQLVAGGHLLLFVTRSEGWFFRPPYPGLPLVGAILATQVVAALMCGFGWLVPAIPWALIGLVWVYVLVWMLVHRRRPGRHRARCSTTARRAACAAARSSRPRYPQAAPPRPATLA